MLHYIIYNIIYIIYIILYIYFRAGGLITPVIRDANLLDVTSLNAQWKELVGKVVIF